MLFNTFCDDHNPIWIRTTLVNRPASALHLLAAVHWSLEVSILDVLYVHWFRVVDWWVQ